MRTPSGSPNRDRDYLLADQYRDTGKLDVRIGLHDRFSTNRYGWHRWVFDRILDLRVDDDGRVLELGCGTAALWSKNLDRIPPGWRITLTDISPGVLDDAARNVHAIDRRFRFEIADAVRLDFDDEGFDLVVANHMLYHVDPRGRALHQIARVLAPGGRLVAASNGTAHLREMDELVASVAPDAPADDAAVHFGLENGAAQLAEMFIDVEVHRYADALRITDAGAFTHYVASTAAGPHLTPDRTARLREIVAERIQRDGFLAVTKDPGAFVATKR